MIQTHTPMQTHKENKLMKPQIDNWFLWGEDWVQGEVHSFGILFLYLYTREFIQITCVSKKGEQKQNK